ncbi:protein SCO1/2 [Paraburkholderia sp. JPY681]|nr:protein SCO1/2 [Paraburkholderia atlantica]
MNVHKTMGQGVGDRGREHDAAAHYALAHDDADLHAHHLMMLDTITSTADYTLPSVMLVRDDGQTVSLKNELDDGRLVVLTFIYTSCTTICPVTSQTLSQLQSEPGRDRDRVRIASISIDPEHWRKYPLWPTAPSRRAGRPDR